MTSTKVARRYAKSLLDLGKERNITDVLFNDMKLVASVIRSNRQLAAMLKSPIIHNFKKDAVIKQIFEGKINDASLEFMRIIIRKNREYYLPEIAVALNELYKEYKNIQPANVTTAVPLDEKLRAQIMAILEKSTGHEIELHEIVDKNIVGGFILQWGDNQLDDSVSGKLRSLKQDFSRNIHAA